MQIGPTNLNGTAQEGLFHALVGDGARSLAWGRHADMSPLLFFLPPPLMSREQTRERLARLVGKWGVAGGVPL